MGLNILPVFGREKEKQTVELYLAFAKLMGEINEVFFSCTKAWIDGDFNKVKKFESEIFEKERTADQIVRTITKNLYTGAFLPGTRGHMHRFSMALDDIVDKMQDTVENYTFMQKRKFNEDIKNQFWKMARETKEAVRIMGEITKKLLSGGDVMADIKRAKEIEHNCDQIERKIFELALFDRRLDPVTSRLICTTASEMAKITDMIEDTCVHVTIVKLIRQA